MTILEKVQAYGSFLSPQGTEDLAAAVRIYRRTYAERWLDEFKAANPVLTDLVDLVANYEFEEAFQQLQQKVRGWIVDETGGDSPDFMQSAKRAGLQASADIFYAANRAGIEQLHAKLKAEIERPRT